MSKNNRFFSPMVEAVASGSTIRAAAAGCGCAESTAYRLTQSPKFRDAVSVRRTEALREAMGKLSGLASDAADCMGRLLTDEDSSVALRASVAILDRFAKLSETIDLRARVEALEARAKQ